MGRRSQRIGSSGEDVADLRLRGIGVMMVERIGTPVKLLSPSSWIRMKLGNQANSVFRVVFGEKVSGDRRGIIEGSGRSVLIETKTILDRNLRWSDLRPHQPGALSRHAKLGGISLLAWVHHTGVYVMLWPVPGFKKGKSISVEQAKELDINDINAIG